MQGEADEVCPLEAMWAFYGQLQEPKELVVIDGADHLFEGKTAEVGEALEDLLGDFEVTDSQIGPSWSVRVLVAYATRLRRCGQHMTHEEAVIVCAVRTAVGKAPDGALRTRARTRWPRSSSREALRARARARSRPRSRT